MKISKILSMILGLIYFSLVFGCERGGGGGGSSSSGSGNSYSNSSSQGSYQEVKETLEDKELNNPLSFLDESATARKNLLGEFVIEGEIINRATIATFKDVTLKVTFYSKTKTNLGDERFTIFEYFGPKSRTPFKIKSYGYKGATSLGWEIVRAKAAR